MLYYRVDCLCFLCICRSIKFVSDEYLNHLLHIFDEYFSLGHTVNELYILVGIFGPGISGRVCYRTLLHRCFCRLEI